MSGTLNIVGSVLLLIIAVALVVGFVLSAVGSMREGREDRRVGVRRDEHR